MSAGSGPASHDKLIEQVLSGEKPGLQELAAAGTLPIEPHQLLELQITLAETGTEAIAATARESVQKTEVKLIAETVSEGLAVNAVRWLSVHHTHPVVVEAAIRRSDLPVEALGDLAPRLDAELQEVLLLRQDAIVKFPDILLALEGNPGLSSYSKRRIAEYRRHLLPRKRKRSPAVEEPEPFDLDELSDDELEEAIEEVKAEPAVGEVDEITGLSESQLRMLPLPARLKLSRRATKALRSILIRDASANVAVSVLENNPMSDGELEQIASNRAVVVEVLSAIARHRQWTRKYPIVLALVKNPRMLVGTAVRLLPRLSVRDLRMIAKDRNVANAVRTSAQRLYKLKSG